MAAVANQENLVQEQQAVVRQLQTELQEVETKLKNGYKFNGDSDYKINKKIQEIKQAGESFNSSNDTEMEYKNIDQALKTAQEELERLQKERIALQGEIHLLGDEALANLARRIDRLTTKVDNFQSFVKQELSNRPNPLLLGVTLVTATENGDVQRVDELLASPYLSTFINFKRATDGLCAVDIAFQEGHPEIFRRLACTPFTGKTSLNNFNTNINDDNWFDVIINESASATEIQYALIVNPNLINKYQKYSTNKRDGTLLWNALHYAAKRHRKNTGVIRVLLNCMSLENINKEIFYDGRERTPLGLVYKCNTGPYKEEIKQLIILKGGKKLR